MIEVASFSSPEAGPRMLILGAVHGDEKCGTIAIRRAMAEIESGELELGRGRVTFVPICNPEAYRLGQRWADRDLNRYMVPTPRPDCYEARLANLLCPLLADCDFLLDLHSYSARGCAFAVVGGMNDVRQAAFASCLGAEVIMSGWAETYAAFGKGKGVGEGRGVGLEGGNAENPAADEEATGTTEYARRFGAVVTAFECGQHNDPRSPAIAYAAIVNALRYAGVGSYAKREVIASPKASLRAALFRPRSNPEPLFHDSGLLRVARATLATLLGRQYPPILHKNPGVIASTGGEPAGGEVVNQPPRHIRLTQVFYQEGGGEFAKNWHNFERVAAGETIAFRSGGSPITSATPAVIVFPKPSALTGEEWFYLAQEGE